MFQVASLISQISLLILPFSSVKNSHSLYTCFRWRSALLWRTFFTTAIVAVVLRAFNQFCQTGKCGLFGQGGVIMFDVSSSQATYDVPDLLAVIFLGIVGGLFGSLHNFLVDKVLLTYTIINKYAPIIPLMFLRILLVAVSLENLQALRPHSAKVSGKKKRNMKFYPSHLCTKFDYTEEIRELTTNLGFS